jgi:hypothetical protein
MQARTSPTVAATGGVLPPRLRRIRADDSARCAGHFLRRSILASDAEQLGDLRTDRPAAS